MFVLIADIQGSHITVAYGYLPDKKQMSYALFLYLILDAFEAYQEDFRAITGRIHLKLRVIVSDYEVSIHLAFRDFFLMRGCYFHWSQVTLIQYALGPVSFTKLFRIFTTIYCIYISFKSIVKPAEFKLGIILLNFWIFYNTREKTLTEINSDRSTKLQSLVLIQLPSGFG